MDKATVTGCSGFIGSHLCKRLRDEGYYVYGCDIKPLPVPGFEPDEFYHVDLRNADEALLFFDNARGTLFALAADMGGIGYILQKKLNYDILRNNLLINLHTAECFRGMPGKYDALFFSSSACIYPQYLQNDVDKPHDLAETDAYPAYPDSEYGWEKLIAEHIYETMGRNFSRKVRIARFHNIFGEVGDYKTERAKAPAALSRKVARAKLTGDPYIQLWGDGLQVRSFCYIDDCLDGIIALMKSNASFPIPVNIGSDEAITIRDLVEMISDIAGYGVVIGLDLDAPQGVRYRNADLEYVKAILGWQPKISLREGMERTYKWIEKQVALDLLEERRG